jgi:hypothetical protein
MGITSVIEHDCDRLAKEPGTARSGEWTKRQLSTMGLDYGLAAGEFDHCDTTQIDEHTSNSGRSSSE